MIILTDAPATPKNELVVPGWVLAELTRRARQQAEACRRLSGPVLDADGKPYYGDDDWTAYAKHVEAREIHDRP